MHEPESAHNRKAYWLCQLAGWFTFAVIESLFVLSTHALPVGKRILAAEWLLAGLDGLLATHLFYLYVRRRRWLQQSGWKLVARLAGALTLMASVLNFMDWFFGYLLERGALGRLHLTPALLFLTWGNWMIVLIAWTALYFAIHEFRERQNRQLHELRFEVAAQEAQLRSLRAQLNPHFLFNCLNGLREVIAEDPARAQSMVEQLSCLLRYSLQTDRSAFVPLADEIEALKYFLALEKVRFEERLRVAWKIDPRVLRAQVPPMLLQTLVENALKHGIARRPQGGEILVSAQERDGQLQLEVRNSGKIPPGSQAGVGLRNTRQRLNLLYGQRAALSLENTGDGRVSAEVRLPVLSAEGSS